jgi:tetratricopeptide (TPR) repeat protein
MKEALVLSPGRDVEILSALILARVGDETLAHKYVDKLSQEFAKDTMLQGYWLPTIRAVLELNRGNTEKAIELLQVASRYETGQPYPFQYFGTMHPVYVRGQTYLKAAQGQNAAKEFQKLLDHRGILVNYPFGALAHLQLGRAYAMQGDTAKAKAAYQDFLTLWKDADPDIPIFIAAKAEYAKLK